MLKMDAKGGRGVGKMLTTADKGGGVSTSPFLADIICEQPITGEHYGSSGHIYWQQMGILLSILHFSGQRLMH